MLLNSRDSELKTLQELCEDFKVESEKQRTSIVILEYQLRKIQTCWKCMKLQENNQCLEAELDQAKKDVELLQSKKLQEQIRLFSSDNHVLKSRSRFLDDRLPVGNWDDTSINQLLQKCSGTSDKAVIGGLQSHLNGLRDEIFNLQEQILRKKSETC
ncbi:hypothetical protein YQE_03680, partial [Dendroctonus ponderosae]